MPPRRPAFRYDLRLTSATCDDAFELNGTPAQARSIQSGQTQTHRLCVPYDQDWVAISAEPDRVYYVDTLNLSASVNTFLELYDRDGATRLAWSDTAGYGNGDTLTFHVPSTGTYYLLVRHADFDQGMPTFQYDLTLTALTTTSVPDMPPPPQ